MNYFFSKILNQKLLNQKVFNRKLLNQKVFNTNNFTKKKNYIKIITGLFLSGYTINFIWSLDFNNNTKSYLKDTDISERYREFKLNND